MPSRSPGIEVRTGCPEAVHSRDVEFVALRVGQQRPPSVVAVVNADDGCAQGHKAFDLGILGLGADEKVEVDTVLDGLGLRHCLEEDAATEAGPAMVDGVIGMTQGREGPPTSLSVYLDGARRTWPASTRPPTKASMSSCSYWRASAEKAASV